MRSWLSRLEGDRAPSWDLAFACIPMLFFCIGSKLIECFLYVHECFECFLGSECVLNVLESVLNALECFPNP